MNTTNFKRYNSFNQIHKGLRAFMYETALMLQHADLSNFESGNKAINQVTELLTIFESHAHGEDRFLNEPLEKSNPEVAHIFEKEHVEDHRLGVVLSDLILQWRAEQTDEGRFATGKNLFYALNEFIAFNLYHMNKEEIELNKVLWGRYSDEEIKDIEQQIIKSHPQELLFVSGKWMMRGLNDIEIVKWLGEIRNFAPAPFFGLLMQIAKEQLNEKRFNAIEDRLAATA